MLLAAVVLGFLLLGLGIPTAAQVSDASKLDSGPLSVDLRSGYATASGDLGDVSDEGFLAGVGISYRVLGRTSLRSELTVESLRRGGRPQTLGGVRGPQTDIWHLLIGVEVELTDAATAPWSVWASLSGGASYFDVSGSLDGGASVPAQTDWKPTVAGGLSLGYALNGMLEAFGRSVLYTMFGDRDREGEFLGNERTLEVSLGLRFSF